MKAKQLDTDRHIIMRDGDYYIVNATALQIVGMMADKTPREDISNFLCVKYGISVTDSGKYIKEVSDKMSGTDTSYILDKSKFSLDAPLSLQWILTKHCNLQCRHCYVEAKNKDFKFPPRDVALQIANKCIKANVFSITLTGGEAFLVPWFFDILELFLTNNVNVKVFTNGTLLNKNNRERLVHFANYRHSLSFLISFDGTREIHDQMRGYGNYEKSVSFAQFLLQNGFPVTANIVINKTNYKDIPNLIDALETIKISSIQISHLFDMGYAHNNRDILVMSREDYQQYFRIMKDYYFNKRGADSFMFSVPDDKKYIFLVNKADGHMQKIEENWECHAGRTKCTITPEFDVLLCPFFPEHKLGNLRRSTIKDLWANIARQKFLSFLDTNSQGRECPVIKGMSKYGRQ